MFRWVNHTRVGGEFVASISLVGEKGVRVDWTARHGE
jgi:hypothetical protein